MKETTSPLMSKKNKSTCFLAFFGISFVIFIVLRIISINIFHYPDIRIDVFFYVANDYFMDFFNPLFFSANKNPYEFVDLGAIYPPICYLFYKFFLLFIPETAVLDRFQIRENRDILMMYFMMTILLICLMALVIIRDTEIHHKFAVVGCLIISYPILSLVDRGNILFISFVFSLYFLVNYNSENKVKRELALIFLAIGAAIKIYPAIFGLILLFDEKRDWKRIMRCVLYGILFFAVPFLYFGVSSVGAFINNLKHGIDVTFLGEGAHVSRMDLKTIVFDIVNFISKQFHLQTDVLKTSDSLSMIAMVVLVALNLLMSFLAKEKWKKGLALVVVVMVVQDFAFLYCCVFFIIPFILWLNEDSVQCSKISSVLNTIYTISLMMIIIPIPLLSNNVITVYVLMVFYFVTIIDALLHIVQFLQHKKKEKTLLQTQAQG